MSLQRRTVPVDQIKDLWDNEPTESFSELYYDTDNFDFFRNNIAIKFRKNRWVVKTDSSKEFDSKQDLENYLGGTSLAAEPYCVLRVDRYTDQTGWTDIAMRVWEDLDKPCLCYAVRTLSESRTYAGTALSKIMFFVCVERPQLIAEFDPTWLGAFDLFYVRDM